MAAVMDEAVQELRGKLLLHSRMGVNRTSTEIAHSYQNPCPFEETKLSLHFNEPLAPDLFVPDQTMKKEYFRPTSATAYNWKDMDKYRQDRYSKSLAIDKMTYLKFLYDIMLSNGILGKSTNRNNESVTYEAYRARSSEALPKENFKRQRPKSVHVTSSSHGILPPTEDPSVVGALDPYMSTTRRSYRYYDTRELNEGPARQDILTIWDERSNKAKTSNTAARKVGKMWASRYQERQPLKPEGKFTEDGMKRYIPKIPYNGRISETMREFTAKDHVAFESDSRCPCAPFYTSVPTKPLDITVPNYLSTESSLIGSGKIVTV